MGSRLFQRERTSSGVAEGTRRARSFGFALVSIALAALVLRPLAHPGDPKGKDGAPAYMGPGVSGARLAVGTNGAIMDFPASNVALLSWMSLPELGGGVDELGSDIWGYVSPSGREYAIIALKEAGTVFVEVTDPLNPRVIETIPGANSPWHDMRTYQTYAYSVHDVVVDAIHRGIQIIDLAGIDAGVVTHLSSSTEAGIDTIHNIAVNEESGFLYAVGGNIFGGGLVAYDLADPLNPSFAGAWGTLDIHDVQVVNYTQGPWAGREIAFASAGGSGLRILDVTNKSSIQVLGSLTYDTLAFTHQGWLSEDRRHFFINDELDELQGKVSSSTTYVVDVVDLTRPRLLKTFTNGRPSIDHNAIVRGRYLYEANYTSGLRIYDVIDPRVMREVGFLDTHPEIDSFMTSSAGFRGAWGVYPLLPSGIVLISDMQRGLFVLDASGIEVKQTARAWEHYR